MSVHVDVCCATGTVTITPMSEEEITAKKERDDAYEAEKAEKLAVREAALKAVLNSKDPDTKAIAAVLGLA